MATEKKQGLISRMIIGSEKSEDYARNSLPTNRWSLFWDIIKGRFWRVVLLNLMMLLFFLPLIALIVYRAIMASGYNATAQFAQGFGLGYQSLYSLTGYAESIAFQVNSVVLLLLPVAFFFAGIGLSGGAYVVRNMVWTEGIFVANDFWRGIKLNFKQIILCSLLYSVLLYLSILSVSVSEQMLAAGTPNSWLFVVSEVFSYIFLVLFTIMFLHSVTMTVTYRVTFFGLIKNSFLMTMGLLPHNLLFVVLAALPFALYFMGSIFSSISLMLIVLLAFSYAMLVWTDYSHWAYDKFINPKAGLQRNRGIYSKGKCEEAEALRIYREKPRIRSELSKRPIKPITDEDIRLEELPVSFNRKDIEKLNDSRKAMYEDNARYIEEHKNDPEFAPTEEEIKLEREEKEREDRKEKAKKDLERNKKKRK